MKNQRGLVTRAACFLAVLLVSSITLTAQATGLKEVAVFNGTDGSSPVSDLIQLPSGNFLGVTLPPALYPNTAGTIYVLTASGAIQVVYRLAADGSQGALYGGPMYDGVTQASDGKIYGLMSQTNASEGIAYRFTLPQGPFEILHSFTLADQGNGTGPVGKLVQAPDGYLYGVCTSGGNQYGNGTIFRIGLDGSFASIYDFSLTDTIGGGPYAGFALHPNGNLYGVTTELIDGYGSLFQFNPATGNVAELAANNAEVPGSLPPLVGNDGGLYVTGKTKACGTCAGQILRYGVDGSGPVVEFTFPAASFEYLQGSLLQVSDGSFMGVAITSEKREQVIFQVTPGTQTAATYPIPQQRNKPMIGNLTQGALGGVVGAMYQIQANLSLGAVLGVNLALPKPLPTMLGFYPATLAEGAKLTVLGDHFVGVQSVTANGLTLPFTVMASGALSVTAPQAPFTGSITVTSAAGSVTSSQILTVQSNVLLRVDN